MSRTEMYVFLEKVKFYAYHGVGEQETKVGNVFEIDLKVETDFTSALRSDELTGTVSYAEVYELLQQEMEIPSRLLEHVAGRIVKRLFAAFPAITGVQLKLSKQNPPMGADLKSAGVEVCCGRETPWLTFG